MQNKVITSTTACPSIASKVYTGDCVTVYNRTIHLSFKSIKDNICSDKKKKENINCLSVLNLSALQRVCIPASVTWKIMWKDPPPPRNIRGRVGGDVCGERGSLKQTPQDGGPVKMLLPLVYGSLWNYVSPEEGPQRGTRCMGDSDLGPPHQSLESHLLEPKLMWFSYPVLLYSDMWLGWVSLWFASFWYSS